MSSPATRRHGEEDASLGPPPHVEMGRPGSVQEELPSACGWGSGGRTVSGTGAVGGGQRPAGGG